MSAVGRASVTTVADLMQLDDLIRIDVGSQDKLHTFHVYADLLTTRSEFFKRALSKQWREGEERVVKLPEVDPQTVRLYMHYLYKGEFAVIPKYEREEYGTSDIYRGATERISLAELYIIVEQMQDTQTKNGIVKAFVASTFTQRDNGKWCPPGAHTVQIIYDGTPEKSPLRRFLVDLYAEFADWTWISPMATWHVEFIREVAICLLAKRDAAKGGPAHAAKKNGGMAYIELKATCGSEGM